MEYQLNARAAVLGASIVAEFHPHLTGIKIAYLFKGPEDAPKKPKKAPRAGKKLTLAKAAKVPDKYRELLDQDFRFVIEFDREYWNALSLDQQKALVDHELCHCGNDMDGCYMKQHDLEEFRQIVERHGFWKDDIRHFAEALPLFETAEK